MPHGSPPDRVRGGSPRRLPAASPARSERPAQPPEAVAFEHEYPGGSWLVSQAFRQLIMTGTKAEDLVSRLARRYGLTHASLNALAAIEAAGGPLPAGEISTRMHYTTGTMTGILDTLERKGYVRRIADPSDRRRVLVDITPRAQHLLNDVLPTVLQAGVHALTAFDDTALRALLETLDAISKGIDAVPDDLPPPPPRRTPPQFRRDG